MPRRCAPERIALIITIAATVIVSALGTAATPAQAVINGTSSSRGHYTVRLVGPFYCSGVAVARRLVVTAAHCASRGMRVHGGGGTAGVASVSRSAVLDDGRRIRVSGDAAILTLTAPWSGGLAPVGDGAGDSFVIAGYGTPDERHRLSFGTLREATLVAAEPRALVDPNRTGSRRQRLLRRFRRSRAARRRARRHRHPRRTSLAAHRLRSSDTLGAGDGKRRSAERHRRR